MSEKSVVRDILFVIFLVGFGMMSRLIPHPSNFTAIGTMALFSCFSFRSNKFLIVIPFLSLALADAVLGFYAGAVYVYAGFAVGMALSFLYFSRFATSSLKERIATLGGLSLVSSFAFFVITNFGVWIGSKMYPQTIGGLMMSYVMGLEFLYKQIAGDLVYGVIVFGIFEYVKATQKVTSQKEA